MKCGLYGVHPTEIKLYEVTRISETEPQGKELQQVFKHNLESERKQVFMQRLQSVTKGTFSLADRDRVKRVTR
jgi:hypothetical protein